MELQIWPSDFGLPSIDTECLQFLACAKFCASPIKPVYSCRCWKSPTGELPFFKETVDSPAITDFDLFVDYLRKSAQDVVLDGELTNSQRCEVDSYISFIRDRLHPALLQVLWLDSSNYETVTARWFAMRLFFPYSLFYVERRRRRAQQYLSSLGRSEPSVISSAVHCINLLSARLGDNKYFFGDKPSSLDAIVFSYLAPLLKLPLPNDRLQLHISACPNLVRFSESILSVYTPLTEEQIHCHSLAVERFIHLLLVLQRDDWQWRRQKAQRQLEHLRLRRQHEANEEKKTSEASPLRDTVIFAVGAVTLSLLFALHTGLLSVSIVDAEDARDSSID